MTARKVLVVEDSPDIRVLIRMLLEAAGHEVVTANDGRAGVASWLFAIAANACRDRRRRDRRANVVPLEAVAEPRARGEGIESTIASRQRRQAVRQALSELSDEQREALPRI